MKYRTFIVSFFALIASLLTGLCAVHAQPGVKKKITKAATSRNHGRGDTVAVVNGVVITYGDFNGIMSGYLKEFVERSHNNVVTDSLYTVIVDSAWDKALADIVIEQEIRKRKLSMSDSEVREAVLTSPPDFLRTQFSDSTGKFHEEWFRSAFLDPRNDTVARTLMVAKRIQMESDRLVSSIVAKDRPPSMGSRANNADTEKAFDVWLRTAIRTAHILDRRMAFGFY